MTMTVDLETPRSRPRWRRRVLFALVALLPCALLLIGVPSTTPRHPATDIVSVVSPAGTTTTTSSCQVVPASVGYGNAFSPAQASYVTQTATVTSLDPACTGATLTVTLEDRTQIALPHGTGTTTVAGPTATVAIGSPPPRAASVYFVHVQLAGGFAVPPDCSGMTFQNQMTATPGSYTITGTDNADLIYGLTGPYTISGLQGADCISAYDGNAVSDGNGNDVVLASVGTTGSNRVTVGNGNDLIKLGNGTDATTVGNGVDTIYGGTGHTTITGGNGVYTVYTGGRMPSGPVPASSGPTSVQVGNGAVTTVYGGNGDLTVVSPTNGSVTIYLSAGPGNVNGGGTKNVCHVPVVNTYTISNCKVVHP